MACVPDSKMRFHTWKMTSELGCPEFAEISQNIQPSFLERERTKNGLQEGRHIVPINQR